MRAIFPINGELFLFSEPSIARVYTKDYCYDLLGFRTMPCGLEELKTRLKMVNSHNNNLYEKPLIWILNYELGGFFYNTLDSLSEHDVLAYEIQYEEVRQFTSFELSKILKNADSFNLTLKDEPNKDCYFLNLNKIKNHLLNGDSYQINYTENFEFKISGNPFHLGISNLLKSKAPYGHFIEIPNSDKSYLSQSPECLFQIGKIGSDVFLETMPIKGTIKNGGNKELLESRKDQAELFMISDLLKNDLNKIFPPNAEVIARKKIIEVPGITHQYSVIRKAVPKEINLWDILEALFPGGSVTGAPKKRSMEIINDLEKRNRGFYCGSTCLRFRSIFKASVNIRSSEINMDEAKLNYQAGGGITILSDENNEFREMWDKLESFRNCVS